MGAYSGRGRHFPVSLLIFFSSWISSFSLLLNSPNNLYSQILSLKIITKYPMKQPGRQKSLTVWELQLSCYSAKAGKFNHCFNCVLTTLNIHIPPLLRTSAFPETNLLENCAGTITKSSVSQDEFLLLLPAESFDPCRKPGESWVGDASVFSCSCCCISPRDC